MKAMIASSAPSTAASAATASSPKELPRRSQPSRPASGAAPRAGVEPGPGSPAAPASQPRHPEFAPLGFDIGPSPRTPSAPSFRRKPESREGACHSPLDPGFRRGDGIEGVTYAAVALLPPL